MTNSIPPTGTTPTFRQAAPRPEKALQPRALQENEAVLAGIIAQNASAPGSPDPLGGDLFSLASTRRGKAGYDLAQMLGSDTSNGALPPDDRFAATRDAMIGTVLDLTE